MPSFNPYLAGLGDLPVADLVSIVFSIDPANESSELEWKSEWPLDSRPRRAELARHIIGFANRDPDRAARIWNGHAFIVIGAAPREWGSAPDADPAEIVQQLEPYAGTEIGWHPVYVERDGHRVLVIVIDPPQWGDPVHALARGSADPESGRVLSAGTVFVRKPGMTVPASEADLKRLEQRASTPAPRLRVAADWNLGEAGNYIGVKIGNGTNGHTAVIREAGFMLAGPVELERIAGVQYVAGEPDKATAYASLPIWDGSRRIEAGEMASFRTALGQLPTLLDRSSELFPYVYYDLGHWLVGEPAPLIALIEDHGWVPTAAAPHTFTRLITDYVEPLSVRGLRAAFDLTAADSR
jgi:hypothetical protein